jgi:hypothetical protein
MNTLSFKQNRLERGIHLAEVMLPIQVMAEDEKLRRSRAHDVVFSGIGSKIPIQEGLQENNSKK